MDTLASIDVLDFNNSATLTPTALMACTRNLPSQMNHDTDN